MSVWNDLLFGFSVALLPINLLAAASGSDRNHRWRAAGLGPAGAIAVLLPITFGIDPSTALVLLAGIYYGSMYGGSITSILVKVPGEAASVVTTLDGYQMGAQGRAEPALAIAAIGSWVAALRGHRHHLPRADAGQGGIDVRPARVSVPGGPRPLMMLPQVTGGAIWKSYALVALGVLIASVGQDPTGGLIRFAPDFIPSLRQGIDFVPVVMGLYGVAEVLRSAEEWITTSGRPEHVTSTPKLAQLWPSREDLKRSAAPVGRGTVLGFLIGLLPAPATSSRPTFPMGLKETFEASGEFGKGAIEGVAGRNPPTIQRPPASLSRFSPLESVLLHHRPLVGRDHDPWDRAGAAPDRRSSSPVLGADRQHVYRQRDAADPQLRWSDCSRNIAADAAPADAARSSVCIVGAFSINTA